MAVRSLPRVRDPFGYFVAYNKRLVEAMVARPKVAQMTRAFLQGVDVFAHHRGIDPIRVDFDARLRRDGTIVIKLHEVVEPEVEDE